jgi:hypothetical protein
VIHGEFIGGEAAITIMADTPSQALFPPPRFTQSSGFIPLPLDFFVTDIDDESVRHVLKHWGNLSVQ